MAILTEDMKRLVSEQGLGFYATVCEDGSPNLSPKGTTRVWDDDHVFFAEIRSPQTVANIRRGSLVEVNVIYPFVRKGYRFKGTAAVYTSGARPLAALVLADIDNFKKVNDDYGHPVGDKILATVATVIRHNVRKDCFVARTGGEEFAIIVEGNTADEMFQICERIRTALETTPFKNSKTGVNYGPITISLGFAMAAEAEDAGELYARSDIALYCAKNAGRNRTKAYEDGMKKEFAKSWLIYKR